MKASTLMHGNKTKLIGKKTYPFHKVSHLFILDQQRTVYLLNVQTRNLVPVQVYMLVVVK